MRVRAAYVYRMPACFGWKNRGSSESTRSSPARVSDTMSRSASARNRPRRASAAAASKRCRMSTPYFAGEVRRADAAELQLQHELADQPLFRVGPVRAAQRQRARRECFAL